MCNDISAVESAPEPQEEQAIFDEDVHCPTHTNTQEILDEDDTTIFEVFVVAQEPEVRIIVIVFLVFFAYK